MLWHCGGGSYQQVIFRRVYPKVQANFVEIVERAQDDSPERGNTHLEDNNRDVH